MSLEKYKERFKIRWGGDLKLSQDMMPFVSEILEEIFKPRIRDNLGTELDAQGSDLTVIPEKVVEIGVRVRRFKKRKYDEFTQDDKEREQMSCDVYFMGYATEDEQGLYSYLVWNGQDFERHRDTFEFIPCTDRPQNEIHSTVKFNCYALSDIKTHCQVYAESDKIAWRNRRQTARGRRWMAEYGRHL